MLAVPAAFAIRFVPAWSNESLLFVVSGVGIIPLAGWLGRATEQLSARTGAGIGGFLNATFGNAAELIIALMALSKGLTTVVKASLTGSIIGNLLLVLGASAFAEFFTATIRCETRTRPSRRRAARPRRRLYEERQQRVTALSVKHLAVRMALFDWLVVGQAVQPRQRGPLPEHSVKGEALVLTTTVVGLRDRALEASPS